LSCITLTVHVGMKEQKERNYKNWKKEVCSFFCSACIPHFFGFKFSLQVFIGRTGSIFLGWKIFWITV
jgi:hypothetical protein